MLESAWIYTRKQADWGQVQTLGNVFFFFHLSHLVFVTWHVVAVPFAAPCRLWVSKIWLHNKCAPISSNIYNRKLEAVFETFPHLVSEENQFVVIKKYWAYIMNHIVIQTLLETAKISCLINVSIIYQTNSKHCNLLNTGWIMLFVLFRDLHSIHVWPVRRLDWVFVWLMTAVTV